MELAQSMETVAQNLKELKTKPEHSNGQPCTPAAGQDMFREGLGTMKGFTDKIYVDPKATPS